jgi:hypothetical protein
MADRLKSCDFRVEVTNWLQAAFELTLRKSTLTWDVVVYWTSAKVTIKCLVEVGPA